MKGVQCNELFGGIAPKNHAFLRPHKTPEWAAVRLDRHKNKAATANASQRHDPLRRQHG